jgi:hypothetical protein
MTATDQFRSCGVLVEFVDFFTARENQYSNTLTRSEWSGHSDEIVAVCALLLTGCESHLVVAAAASCLDNNLESSAYEMKTWVVVRSSTMQLIYR